MALQSYRTTFTTGTGTTPVSLTGFGFAPKAVRFRWIGRTGTADGISRGTADFGWGFAVSGSDRAVCAHSTDAAGTSACRQAMLDDSSIATVSGAGALVGKAHIASWDSGGVTIAIGSAFGVDLEVEVIAWGGDDITNVAIGNTAAEPAATGTVDTTGVGFPPDSIQFIGISQVSSFASPSQIQANSSMFAGHAVKNPAGTISNGVLANGGKNGVATTVTVNYCRVGECIARFDATPGATLDAFANVSAIIADGFTLNWGRVNATGVTRIYFYLAIKGGQWEIPATITQPTSTATDIAVTTNFTPNGAMFFSSARTAAETQGTATNSSQDNYGSAIRDVVAGTTSEGEMLVRDTNGQVGSVVSTYSNHTHSNATMGNGVLTVEMHTTTWGGTSITCRMTTADATQRRFHAFTWGSGLARQVYYPEYPGQRGVGPPTAWVRRAKILQPWNDNAQAPSGDIVGTDSLTVTTTGAITGDGALAGTATLTLTSNGTLLGTGQLAASASCLLDSTGALTGTGTLTGSASLTLTTTGTTFGSGALVGSETFTGTTTGALAGAGQLASTTACVLTATATITGGIDIVGSTTLLLTPTGAITGNGALATNTTFNVQGTGTALASGALAAVGTIATTADGVLLGAGVAVGSASIAFTGSATLTGTGALVGTSTIVFSETGLVTDGDTILGNATLTVTAAGTLGAIVNIAGTTATTLTTSATLTGNGALNGTTGISVTTTGAIQGLALGTGISAITFTSASTLLGAAALIANDNFTLSATGTGTGVGTLAGAANLALTTTAPLSAVAGIVGVTSLTLTGQLTVFIAFADLSGFAQMYLRSTGTLRNIGRSIFVQVTSENTAHIQTVIESPNLGFIRSVES